MKKQSNKKKWIEKNKYLVYLITFFLGVAGATFINYIFKGELYLDGIIIVGTYVTIGIIFIIIRRKLKKSTIPDADERVKSNIFKFYFSMAHIFLGLLFLTLAVLTFLEKDSIPLYFLWIYFFTYIASTGIGSLIAKRI